MGPGTLKRADDRRRQGQRARKPRTTAQIGLRPDQLLHTVLRLHPWSARLAPARRCSDGEFQSLGVSGLYRMAERILPSVRHIGQPVGYDLRGHQIGVEILDPANAHARHPVEILVDPVLRHVAVHPVPPDARARRLGRVDEAIGQIVGQRWRGKGDASQQGRKANGFGHGHNPCSQGRLNRRPRASIQA